jgi:hypothetical protein
VNRSMSRPSGRLRLPGLHPARYRAVHGEEIAAVHAERGQLCCGSGAAWRRTPCGCAPVSARPIPQARVAAAVAPLVLAGTAGLYALSLLPGLRSAPPCTDLTYSMGPAPASAIRLVAAAPWILGPSRSAARCGRTGPVADPKVLAC